MNSSPDLIVQHLKSIGFDVRLTGNEREVVFAARECCWRGKPEDQNDATEQAATLR